MFDVIVSEEYGVVGPVGSVRRATVDLWERGIGLVAAIGSRAYG